MIQLSGKKIKTEDNLSGDIEIKITGLRPGEKLYKELLVDANASPTDHPLIFKAKEKISLDDYFWDKIDLVNKAIGDNQSKNN